MRYVIDHMTMSDVSRIIEIERLAYPSTWPPSAYRKELQENRWAHYIVLRDTRIAEEQMSVSVQGQDRHRRFFPLTLCRFDPLRAFQPPVWLRSLVLRDCG